jgi:hypothetical protein
MTASHQIDPRAWRADTIDPSRFWYYPLSARSRAALEKFDREFPKSVAPVTSLRAPEWLAADCAKDIKCILAALESGRGFVVIVPGHSGQYPPPTLTLFYWLIGDMMGQPIEQNVQGTLLYDVRDTGQDVRYGARFSVTNSESSFHTDNSFGADVLDYVGLLCLNSAKAGGASQIVSGFAVQDELRERHPDVLQVLRQPFHVDRRGGLRPGDEPTVRFPALAGDDAELVIRYLRYWIEVGHEKAGVPLTAEQTNALDVLDRVASEPQMRVEFEMKPGEMLFVNNRWILHNRTAFEDHPEPERRRHLIRLWVRR